MNESGIPRVNVLGTGIGAFNMDTAVETIEGWISDDTTGRYVCVAGVHGVMESLHDSGIRRAFSAASACVPDGMPMTWVGHWYGFGEMDRVYGPDLMLRLLEVSAEKGYTNFFYGGNVGVADELKTRMEGLFPGLNVTGTYCPPFRPLNTDERAELVEIIDRARPDFMWIGLSTPKQDLFMNEYCKELKAKVMLGVGAAFDFHTGRVSQAPRWMMRAGLEWFYRLCSEPRRLGPRYLRHNPTFIWNMLLQVTRLRRYPME